MQWPPKYLQNKFLALTHRIVLGWTSRHAAQCKPKGDHINYYGTPAVTFILKHKKIFRRCLDI